MSSNDDTTNGAYSGDIDPEIAELIGVDDEDGSDQPGTHGRAASGASDQPDFSDLFDTDSSDSGHAADRTERVDLSRERFPSITKREGPPRPFFKNKSFYKTALSGEGEAAKRLHSQLAKFLNTEDPQERSLYRGRVVSAFWNVAESIARKIHSDLPEPKRIVLRYGAVVPNLISAEQRNLLQRIIFENETGEPVHYVDEWLRKIALGQVTPSATDEVKASKKDSGSKIAAQLEKTKGQWQTQHGLLSTKLNELDMAESALRVAVDHLTDRGRHQTYSELKLGYAPEQRARFSEISNLMRQISATDKEIERMYRQLDNASEQLEALEEQAKQVGV